GAIVSIGELRGRSVDPLADARRIEELGMAVGTRQEDAAALRGEELRVPGDRELRSGELAPGAVWIPHLRDLVQQVVRGVAGYDQDASIGHGHRGRIPTSV